MRMFEICVGEYLEATPSNWRTMCADCATDWPQIIATMVMWKLLPVDRQPFGANSATTYASHARAGYINSPNQQRTNDINTHLQCGVKFFVCAEYFERNKCPNSLGHHRLPPPLLVKCATLCGPLSIIRAASNSNSHNGRVQHCVKTNAKRVRNQLANNVIR